MTFDLWRQDDNGNRFLVGTFADQAAAERRLAELTRIQHKQTYWIARHIAEESEETSPCR
uniref:SPOR domain-containing protein n=1 Tax=Geobacter metallireducens TaxID=28232 RepID=A0A831TXA1_GEOME